MVFCVSAKYSAIIFLEAKVSSFSVNHSAMHIYSHAVLYEKEMSLIIHLLVGGDRRKEKMKGITFSFHQFGAEFLCYSPLSSS